MWFPVEMLTSLCVSELWPAPFVSASPSLSGLCLLPTDGSCGRFLALFLSLWVEHVSLLYKSKKHSFEEILTSKIAPNMLDSGVHDARTSFSRVTAVTSFLFSLLLLSVVRLVFSCYLLWWLDC